MKESTLLKIVWIGLGATLVLSIIIMVMLSMVVFADGSMADDDYRIGVDPAPPGTYHRLYVPVMMEGNVTRVEASFDLVRTGSGSPRFSVEFLDNTNFELRQRGGTAYERFTTGSSVGVTTSFSTAFNLSRNDGWPNGVYWFCVDKELEANDWCFISWSVVYKTTEVGNGALVEERFDGIEASVVDVTRDVELVDARVDALEGDLHGLEQELDAQVLALQLAIEKANFTQREEYIAALATVDARAIAMYGSLNTTLRTIIEALDAALRADLYNVTGDVELALAELNATVADVDALVRADHARVAGLEARVAALERALGIAERALNDTRADVDALDNETAVEPSDMSPLTLGAVVIGVPAAISIGVVAYSQRELEKIKKEG